MAFKPSYCNYNNTGFFSKLVIDYLEDADILKTFYSHRPNIDGIKASIEAKQKKPINRTLLVDELLQQYQSISTSKKVLSNIELLKKENCFTVCTAHQPNIFTGHLYFVYKIVHAIKLAEELNMALGDYHFVPVYYMGSEDADLQELGEVHLNGIHHQWKTNQKGAVGRMKIDKAFLHLMAEIKEQLNSAQHGNELRQLLDDSYVEGASISDSTFRLVDSLFKEFGLIVLLPDNANFKKAFADITQKELFDQFSNQALTQTINAFPKEYNIQVKGRDLNFFYLKDDIRERLEYIDSKYIVNNTSILFTESELREELNNHPERFSPNVILRPCYQEFLLPNVAFIGGGGELGYWLELKNVFDSISLPFPVLVLRNSFLLIDKKRSEEMDNLQLQELDLFDSKEEIFNAWVLRNSKRRLLLEDEKNSIASYYDGIEKLSAEVDVTLQDHVKSLKSKSLDGLHNLEKKIIRAEKRKFIEQGEKINNLKKSLFPLNNLQERVDNILPFYATYGNEIIKQLYIYSKGLDQQFCFLTEE